MQNETTPSQTCGRVERILFSRPDPASPLIVSLIFVLLNVLHVLAGNPVSVDDFKKAKPLERRKMLDQAPPEQKEALKKLDTHLTVVDLLGGEERLKDVKESDAARARGFQFLESIFLLQTQCWSDYIAGVSVANEKAGMAPNDQQAVKDKLYKVLDALGERQSKVRLLVFNLAASPKALELDRRAGDITDSLVERLRLLSSAPGRYITKEEIVKLDEEADQVYSELKRLPSLTPEQSRKEFDSVSEDKIIGRFHNVIRSRQPPPEDVPR